jgi:hypothetical protein
MEVHEITNVGITIGHDLDTDIYHMSTDVMTPYEDEVLNGIAYDYLLEEGIVTEDDQDFSFGVQLFIVVKKENTDG